MISKATTTVTVMRGTAYDPVYGDEIDADTVVHTGIIASIIEQTVDAKTEATSLAHSYRYAKMRCTPGKDIRVKDRIKDEKTDEIWTIIQISRRGNPVVKQDMRIDLAME